MPASWRCGSARRWGSGPGRTNRARSWYSTASRRTGAWPSRSGPPRRSPCQPAWPRWSRRRSSLLPTCSPTRRAGWTATPRKRPACVLPWPCREVRAVGGLAAGIGLLAADERVQVTFGPLQEPVRAAGKIEVHLRAAQAETLHVDDVHVRPVAGGEHAAIAEADRPGGVAGLPRDDVLDAEAVAVAVPRPVGEQEIG